MVPKVMQYKAIFRENRRKYIYIKKIAGILLKNRVWVDFSIS